MRDRFSLFELARLPEQEAVLRRFDARNLSLSRWLARGLAATAFVHLILAFTGPSGSTLPRLVVALGEGALAVGYGIFLRKLSGPGSGGALERHPRLVLLAFLASALALFLLYSSGREEGFVWLLIVPWIAALLCLRVPERLTLHAYCLAASGAAAWLYPPAPAPKGHDSELWGPTFIINVLSLGTGLFLTRRFRRAFLEQWRDLHVHAQEQSRMREEIESARDVQLAMLPEESPAAGGLDIAAMSLPASEVGGDYFGYFGTGDGGFAVAAADVAGHGLASGIVLSGIRSGLTVLADELDSPSRVLGRMHRMVRATNRHHMLVTLAILLFDPGRRRALVASAGHPPVLWRRAGDGTVEEVSIPSLPLGAGLVKEFPERSFDVAPGDLFLLHSDGIYEAVNPAREPYGMERLEAAFAREGSASGAKEVRDALLRDLWGFRGSAPQQDDLTLIVVRVL